MTTTNCNDCGVEIEAEISCVVDTGHLCPSCHFDYKCSYDGFHT